MESARGKTLLEAVIAELDRNGLGDRSLRDLAAAVGTSHRMLIHHFGSREGLLVAVVEAVEAHERDRSEVLTAPPDLAPADALRLVWERLSSPSQAGRERLFFECYARGLQAEAPFNRLLPDAVDTWLDASIEAALRTGVSQADARSAARLGLAVVRGLLLDLLATGDRDGTTRALDLYAGLLEAALPPATRS
jgi:AcrR family transcriptional regulator